MPIKIKKELIPSAIKEVLEGQAAHYPPDRTVINMLGIEEQMELHPKKYPVLRSLTPVHMRREVFKILEENDFTPTSHSRRKNGSASGRAFWRPKTGPWAAVPREEATA